MRIPGSKPGHRSIITVIPTAIIAFLMMVTIGTSVADTPTTDEPWTWQPLTDEERDKLFKPGPEWQGQGAHGRSQAEMERFTDYPLVWLGESFAGYNLQGIVRQQYNPPDDRPEYEAIDSVTFGYGSCVIPDGGDACAVPIVVAVEPVCSVRPEWIANGLTTGRMETTEGGAQMLRFRDGHLRLWSGSVSLYIDAPADQTLTDRMVAELRDFNDTGLLTTGQLPPPDFGSCPILDETPAANSSS